MKKFMYSKMDHLLVVLSDGSSSDDSSLMARQKGYVMSNL